ncbi:MAG: LLM class F420-dependent oxidoreductase [Actinobacteria bacterium]|nr:LLM class F420-dependent oxidoreductase [Actinomycetota bacterium]
MKFAIIPPVRSDVTADPDWMTGFARHAEALGFESIVLVEHAVVISGYEHKYPYSESGRMPLPDQCIVPDPLDLLAYLAAVTTTLKLATGVLILPEHHPVVLAKRLATIDQLSAGRVRLCVGVGWMKEELEACGIAFSTRGRRTDECIDVLRLLWGPEDENGLSFSGEFFEFDHAHSNPKPAQEHGIAIHIGGHTKAAARRAGLRGDGFQPLGLRGEELTQMLKVMNEAAEESGRDPSALELSLGGALSSTTEESVAEAAQAGAHRLVVSPSQSTELAAVCDEMSAFAERIHLQPMS